MPHSALDYHYYCISHDVHGEMRRVLLCLVAWSLLLFQLRMGRMNE